MKRILKRAAAALLSLTLLGAAMPFEAGTFALPQITLTAKAADAQSTAVLDEATGVLTLRGNVVKADVRDFSADTRVKAVAAAEGTVLPADCSDLFSNFISAETINLKNADTSHVTNMHDMFYGCRACTLFDLTG